MEWQKIGKGNWIFGVKVRGIVREMYAQVEYVETCRDKPVGWMWSANGKKGFAEVLPDAIAAAEHELVIES